MDPRTQDWEPGDSGTQGPREPRPMELNWHTLYVYIHSTCVSNRSTGMHYGMDYAYSRWHLCSSCFCPFPLYQTSVETPVRCTEQHPLNILNVHMHEQRPSPRQSWL